MNSLKGLSDKELTARLRQLVSKEQSLTLSILPHLAEVERRRLYFDLGYRSLYEYCTRELKYSESAAMRRICGARTIEKCPSAMDYLERNLVNLSTLSLVWKYVTPEFLSRIGGKSKKEVEAIVAEFHPALPIPDRTKPVVVEKVVKQTDDTGQQGSHKCQEIYRRSGGKLFVSVDKSAPDRDEEVVRKKVKMHDVRCLIDDTVMRDLERCKALLSGKFPKGMSYSEFLGELAGDWLKHHDPLKRAERRSKKKRRAGVEARVKSTKEDSRYIPLAVRDDVYKRDGGTCSFVGSNGKRCNSDYSLQYDHYPVPYARGGPSTVNNLRLLCAKHNRYAAEKTYGEGFIQKFVLRESGSKITYDACQYNAEHSPAYRYQARVWDRPPPVLH